MDPQHQTENLHENDLAEFFRNFGQFWEKHGNTILIVAMVLVLAFAGYRFYSFRTTEQHESAWYDLAFETSPAGFREVAQTHDNPAVQALAYLRGGDLLLARALAPADAQPQPDEEPAASEDAATPEEPATPDDPAQLLEDAADMYRRAMDVAPTPLYRLNAMLGLASVAESQQRWDEAETLYREVIESAERYPTLAAQAEERLKLLPDLRTPVAFAPGSATPAAPAETGNAQQPVLPSVTGPGLDIVPETGETTPTNEAAPTDPAPAEAGETAPVE